MPTINQLSSTSSLASGDQIPVYDASDGDARKASLSTLLSFIEANFANPELETQTFAPTGSGFTVTATASTSSIWMIINPTGAFASGTVQFPPDEDCFDGQVIVVTSSQAITSLTVDGNGATVAGAPSALGTNGFAQFRYQASATKWWCVAQSLGGTDTFANITITGAILDENGNEVLEVFTPSAAAVNHLIVANATTGTDPGLVPDGVDAAIGIRIETKGGGDIRLQPSGIGGVTITSGSNGIDIDAGVTGGVAVSGDSINLQATTSLTTSPLVTPSVETLATTVANLGSAAVTGVRRFVTDANATTFASIVAGGGANRVPVYSDGTNWRIG